MCDECEALRQLVWSRERIIKDMRAENNNVKKILNLEMALDEANERIQELEQEKKDIADKLLLSIAEGWVNE